MAYKQFTLDERTTVTIYKRRANRSLRLTVAADGAVRVTMPPWVPYWSGLEFARSRREWIAAQQPAQVFLAAGQAIGKAHHIQFVAAAVSRPSSRIRPGEIIVTHPVQLTPADPAVQKVAETAGIRALRRQAEQLLPRRLQELAERHNFNYASVTIKRLKSRWGSCDQHRNIVLNVFLMQLPWECIDYVILHELAHTQVLRHGPDFWSALEDVLPDTKRLRKTMRSHQPVLHSGQSVTVA